MKKAARNWRTSAAGLGTLALGLIAVITGQVDLSEITVTELLALLGIGGIGLFAKDGETGSAPS